MAKNPVLKTRLWIAGSVVERKDYGRVIKDHFSEATAYIPLVCLFNKRPSNKPGVSLFVIGKDFKDLKKLKALDREEVQSLLKNDAVA